MDMSIDLADGRFLFSDGEYENAVCLTDAALRPWCHVQVTLVKDHPMYVLLLAEP